MTDIEQKALALVIECVGTSIWKDPITRIDRAHNLLHEALCRAIERDKAFRQEVSDVFEATISALDQLVLGERDEAMLRGIRIATARFIIAKSDPLAEAIKETHDFDDYDFDIWADQLRAAIEKRGGKIIFNEEQN